MIVDGAGDIVGKAVPVYRQRTARRQLVPISRAHDERIAAAHFLMQQADGILLVVVGAEAVGTDQLGKAVSAVSVGRFDAAHFVDDHGGARLSGLPCGLGACETAANDVDGF